jgi:hypothetical protein
MNTELYETKVDKVLGKGLTKNEFTDAEKKASRNCYKCRSKRSKRLQADNNGRFLKTNLLYSFIFG